MPIVTEIKIGELPQIDFDSLDKSNIPVLVLRNMVLFPNATTPVSIGREKSLKLIEDTRKTHQPIVVVCQKNPDIEEPNADEIYEVGVIAHVLKVITAPDETKHAILQAAGKRVHIDQITGDMPYMRANVSLLEDAMVTNSEDREFAVIITSIRDIATKMLNHLGDDGKEMLTALRNIEAPASLVSFIATNFPIEAAGKQEVLEETTLKQRAILLYSLLIKEAEFIEIKDEITRRTRENLTEQQREHYLMQQMRVIREELGDTSDEDIINFQKRAEKKLWSKEVKDIFNKELRKLERLNPSTPDYSVLFNYLDTLLNMPWNEKKESVVDVPKVERQLNRDHFGLENVKERILEHISVLKMRGDMKSPIICLVGPPGVGKTSLGKSIATALGREYVRMSFGGLHDESEIRGHRRTYIGAMPGRIIQSIIKSKTCNPVFVLDEIDKIGKDYKGDPSSALLEVLDPEQNDKFHDNFVDIDFDLSNVLFIATANTLNTLSQPLLDRMEIIDVSGYILEEKVEIARKHLVPKQLAANGFAANEIKFHKSGIIKLIDSYTRESGVRSLEKQIAKVLRRIARAKESGKDYPTTIKAEDVTSLLGAEKMLREVYEGNEYAGVVTGLAWTAVGGEILFIESSINRGKGEKLTLTGNLGDVMKESAIIAMQYIKANCDRLGINHELFGKYDVHVHVPEGATPKDGPSAGITMVTSLVSSFTQRKVKANLAMTGEITLRGKVLPVGGIKEKILAAKRAGIKEIILCSKNKRDIEEINEVYLKGLTFHYVDTIREVLDIALLPELVDDAIEL